MSRLMLSLLCVVGVAGAAKGAGASEFGSYTLRADQMDQIQLSTTGRPERFCNELSSTGRVGVRIGQAAPTELGPGECIQDTGGTMIVENDASGPVTVDYRRLGPNK